MNVFEKAAYDDKTESVRDFDEAEKKRQAESVAKSGLKSVDEIKSNVFEKAAAELAKEKTPDMPGKMPSELNLMRRRLGMKETGVEAPEDAGKSFPRKIYDFMGQRTGLGATAGSILGTALAPETGGLSILLPMLAAGGGASLGAISEGKDPLKRAGRKPTCKAHSAAPRSSQNRQQFARKRVKTFGGRTGVSEAAEGLMKKWFAPQVAAETLYKQAAAKGVHVPLGETATVVDDILKNEVSRMPTEAQEEILKVVAPLQNFITPTMGKTKTRFLTSQPVEDSLADIRRLSAAARKAFGGKNPNSDLGNMINRIRAAMFDDLEKVGVPEARQASEHYRRQMAIETLSEQIARPIPGVKLRDAYRKNALFDKSFSKAEKEQIDRIVKKLEVVAPSGGAGISGKIATAGAGAAIGGLSGVPMAHELGGLAGYVGSEKIRELLASPAGRDFMEKVLADTYKMGTGKVVQSVGPVLSIFARGLMGQREEEQ
jgi:hypothetical protein